MYTVVGCGDCSALWIVEDRPETTACPRCGTRHEFAGLRRLAETPDLEDARRARAGLLADRHQSGNEASNGATFETQSSHGEQEAQSPDPRTVIRAALRELDSPDRVAILEYASARGIDATIATRTLTHLVQQGAATEVDGMYRLA